uniref:Uncharacterized protein n=1 Tax=Escherichia coli TaxID=562 RepID=A0A6G6AL57_ECOLX|nr:hypothetical protein [Escherichia coli]
MRFESVCLISYYVRHLLLQPAKQQNLKYLLIKYLGERSVRLKGAGWYNNLGAGGFCPSQQIHCLTVVKSRKPRVIFSN